MPDLKWRKGTIRRHLATWALDRGEDPVVQGMVYGGWGVHKVGLDAWGVTHLPTGCSAGAFDFQGEAKAYCERLEAANLPKRRFRFAQIPAKNHPWTVAAGAVPRYEK